MHYRRNPFVFSGAVLVLASLLVSPGRVSAQSILEAVLAELLQLGNSTPSLLANLAVNGRDPGAVTPMLAPGDLVLIGYDRNGTPLYETVGLDSLVISSAVAAAESSGLPAGTYPLSMPLYTTPSGGLAIYDATATGSALPPAILSLSRIDGSIRIVETNLRSQQYIAGSGPVETIWGALGQSSGEPAAVTTVIGAVNAGQLVTAVSVGLSSNATGSLRGIESATIAHGANSAYMAASAGRNEAVLSVVGQLGAAATPLAAANIASNLAIAEGAIHVQISRVSAHVGALVTTTIGAVNSGSISGSGP